VAVHVGPTKGPKQIGKKEKGPTKRPTILPTKKENVLLGMCNKSNSESSLQAGQVLCNWLQRSYYREGIGKAKPQTCSKLSLASLIKTCRTPNPVGDVLNSLRLTTMSCRMHDSPQLLFSQCTALRSLLSKIACKQRSFSRKKLVLTVSGGSVSANNESWGYVQSVGKALGLYFNLEVEVRNGAIGGRTSHVASYCMKFRGDEDIIILEHSVNDAELVRHTMFGEMRTKVFSSTLQLEHLINRSLLESDNALIVMPLLPGLRGDKVARDLLVTHKALAEKLGIFVVDVAQVVRKSESGRFNFTNAVAYYSDDYLHPGTFGHQTIGCMVLQRIVGVLSRSCNCSGGIDRNAPLTKVSCLDIRDVGTAASLNTEHIKTPSTIHIVSAYKFHFQEFNRRWKTANAGQQEFEMKIHKSSWVATEPGASLVFKVLARSIEVVIFQHSYDMGMAEASVDGVKTVEMDSWFRGMPAKNGRRSRNKPITIFNDPDSACKNHEVALTVMKATNKFSKGHNFQVVAILWAC